MTCPRCKSSRVEGGEDARFCKMCGHRWAQPIVHADPETQAAAREEDEERARQERIADAVGEAAAERVPPPGGWS